MHSPTVPQAAPVAPACTAHPPSAAHQPVVHSHVQASARSRCAANLGQGGLVSCGCNNKARPSSLDMHAARCTSAAGAVRPAAAGRGGAQAAPLEQQRVQHGMCTACAAQARCHSPPRLLAANQNGAHHERPRLDRSRAPGARPSGPSMQRAPILAASRKGVQGRKASMLQLQVEWEGIGGL